MRPNRKDTILGISMKLELDAKIFQETDSEMGMIMVSLSGATKKKTQSQTQGKNACMTIIQRYAKKESIQRTMGA